MAEMTREEILDFATRLAKAVEAGDAATAMTFYAPHAKIWHNVDYKEIDPQENTAIFAKMKQALPNQKLSVLSCDPIEGGYVMRDRLEANLPDGTPFRLSTCMVVRLEHGLITRVDEYLDSAEVAPLLALAQ